MKKTLSTKSFDEKYMPIIEEMKQYLEKDNLTMIEFLMTDKWHFKLNKRKR